MNIQSEPDKHTRTLLSLTQRFAIAGIITISLATFIVMKLITIRETESILHASESYAIQISEHLNKEIFRSFIAEKIEWDGEKHLETQGNHEDLEKMIFEHIDSFEIEKVVIFNSVGEIVYSSTKSGLGVFKGDNPNVLNALKNSTSSLLKKKNTKFEIDGQPLSRDLLETYTPLAEYNSDFQKTGKILGVIETYQNGNLISEKITHARHQIAVMTVSTMGALFFILFIWIRLANTTIKNQRAEIEEHNANLEQRVTDSTQALAHTQDQLVRVSRLAAIGTLSAGIAHDINNPLATITTCAEGLVARAQSKMDDETQKEIINYSEMILKNSLFCKNITFKLLNLVKKGSPTITTTHLFPTLQQLVTLSLPRFKKENKSLINTVDPKLKVKTDEIVVQQIIANFISNACDNTNDKGIVELSSTENNEEIILTVKDNGNGIPEKYRSCIFEPFFTTRDSGNGMGLAISKHLSKQINGTIDFQSSPEETSFNLRLKT